MNLKEREEKRIQAGKNTTVNVVLNIVGEPASNVNEKSVQEIEFGATQGKKGHKAPRINMAFHPEVHSWIKTRSRQLGISATEFVNRILYEEMTKGE